MNQNSSKNENIDDLNNFLSNNNNINNNRNNNHIIHNKITLTNFSIKEV